MTKDLKEKAVRIQGKEYVLVADRILFFNEEYPAGSISTELVSNWDSEKIVVKATVMPDVEIPQRIFTGYSQTVIGQGMVNKSAALENAETSAVGRALAMLGIGVIESVASVDEMVKAGVNVTTHTEEQPTSIEVLVPCDTCGKPATERQGVTKAGKPYHGIFCTTGDKDHTKWLATV